MQVLIEACLLDASGALLTKESEFIAAIPPHENFYFLIRFPSPYRWQRSGSQKVFSFKNQIKQGTLTCTDTPSKLIPIKRVITTDAAFFDEFRTELKKYAPMLTILKHMRSESNELIFTLQGGAGLAPNATIVIPNSETQNLRGIANRISMSIKISREQNSPLIQKLLVSSENSIRVERADDPLPMINP